MLLRKLVTKSLRDSKPKRCKDVLIKNSKKSYAMSSTSKSLSLLHVPVLRPSKIRETLLNVSFKMPKNSK
jgi:hypothetical protein